MFTETASQHGGQEATILSFHTVLLHLGFIVVGLPYSFKGQLGIKDVHGIAPYGATTIVGADGARMASALEIEAAQYQGRHVAESRMHATAWRGPTQPRPLPAASRRRRRE